MKQHPAIIVGGKAYRKSINGLIDPCSKVFLSSEKLTGFGALAITVNPPPVTAPATSAYLLASDKCSTSDPR